MSAPVHVALEMDQSWRYAAPAAMARFCAGLKERRIEALRCGGCGRRYLPPRPVCGNCHLPLADWVPVADEGRLEAWTVVHVPILDPRTGRMREAPYGMGLVRLDGADTTLNHFLAQSDPARLAIGQRVRAVWREQLAGAIDDIRHFEVLA
ncbi:MAG: Zn-ribbon domain-containing OB-fold protein [Burkholderiales bacterium]|nr:Zn-ribbon domain-containing OB-fold protein [Burkholderiales bacterium]